MKTIIKTLMILSVILALPISASAAYSVDLLAGQHYYVGTVSVTDDGIVTYATIPGCVLTETHLHVAGSVNDIPQTKKGNPIPGKFMYNDHHNPPVNIISYETGQCGDLVIAAHAVVSCIDISSTATMSVVSDTSICLSADETCPISCAQNAVEAWEYNLDDPNPADPNNSYWDNATGNFFTGTGADWIWNSYRVLEPVYGEIVEFQKCFNIPGLPISGNLYITADNGYEAKVNHVVVDSAQLIGDWRNSLLTQPCPNIGVWGVENTGWQGIPVPTDVTNKLHSGQNSLHITGVNEAKMDLDTQGDFPELEQCPDSPNWQGNIRSNPGGLIFTLDILYATDTQTLDETAWASGDDFPGRNWATYFTYTTCTQ